MTQFFDQDNLPSVKSYDDRQTDLIIAAVNSNHRDFVDSQRAQPRTERLTPTNPSFLRRNLGNIAAVGVGLVLLGAVVELGLRAAEDQAEKTEQLNDEMYQQQLQMDQIEPYDLEP